MKNGLYCSAGYDWFSIGSEGRVSTCNALIYRTDFGIYLGNILKEDIKLRKEEFRHCPIQECQQVCDRHWSRKEIYTDGALVDTQPVVNPSAYAGIKRPVSILFAPTWKCNYACTYCTLPTKQVYPQLPDACDVHPASDWVTAFERFFATNGIDGGIWHTNGGEPLFYNGIEDLFSFFHAKKFKIALTTNVSADVYKKVVMAAPPEAFGIINCSLHPTDKNFRWELFKNRVQLLKALKYPVSVNFVGHPDQIMLAPDYADWCKSIDVPFSLIPVIGCNDGVIFRRIEDYPEPLRNLIRKYSPDCLQDTNRFSKGGRVE